MPYKAAHLMMLNEQDTQKYWDDTVKTPGYARALELAGPAHTAMRGDKVLCCSGVMEMWPGRAMAWAVMSQDIGFDYLAICRAVKRFLKLSGYKRVEATVGFDYEPGLRFIELMGFKRETPEPMLNYAPNGKAHFLYSLVVP